MQADAGAAAPAPAPSDAPPPPAPEPGPERNAGKRKAEAEPEGAPKVQRPKHDVVDGKVTLTIECDSAPPLNGAIFTATFEVKSTVKAVKAELATRLGVKPNKVQLKHGGSFLKDLETLEKKGVLAGSLHVLPKKRGGK